MTNEQQQNYVSLFTTLVITLPYYFYVYFRYQQETFVDNSAELVFWANAILLLIPIRIISQILITIVGTILSTIITGEEPKDITDERDQIINLKGTRNSYYTFVLGFLLAIISIALGYTTTTMFTLLILFGFLAELVETVSKIYYYNRGS